jgi:hypothetical protein
MKRYAPILLVVSLVAGCSEPPAETPRVETPSGEATAAGADREGVAATSGLPQPRTETALLDCRSMDGFAVHCGFRNPEDLVRVPDGTRLIVSEMGEFLLDTPGRLSSLELASGERAPIAIDWSADGADWGEATCEAPDLEAFSPHGIDLVTRDDGRHALLVVNHGLRESVEFFELAENDDAWALTWRGCALPPGDPFVNDVAGLRGGGFLVTHMWDKSLPFETIVERFQRGERLGWVWAWAPGTGFTKLEGSELVMPNGIALSPDEAKLFVNDYLGNRTVRIDRATGEVDGSFEVRQPDNVTVDADGTLWVASHQHDPTGQTCAQVTAGPCLLPYRIVRADPESLETEVVLDGDGPPMGYATVALRVADRLYLGSAHGDRVVSVALAEAGE